MFVKFFWLVCNYLLEIQYTVSSDNIPAYLAGAEEYIDCISAEW